MPTVSKYIETEVDVDVELDDFDDEEIKEEYRKRFNGTLEDTLEFINKHYWNDQEWSQLQNAINNAIKYPRK